MEAPRWTFLVRIAVTTIARTRLTAAMVIGFFMVYLTVVRSINTDEVLVQIRNGSLRGWRRTEEYNIGPENMTDTVDQYLGVPFAAPPTGTLRFKPPLPPGPWEGVWNSTQPGRVCPQKVYYSQTAHTMQSEDCLSLNIYSPVIKRGSEGGSRARYPVMVFLHGGSYEEGAGCRYDGFPLASHGIVVVTLNYRLGLLGYLSSGDERLEGNYGLMDQIQALAWIQENIAQFRGDPGRVTIFGSSAGASSVGLLLLAPPAKGLFHQAIIESGAPVAFWAVYNQSVDHAAFTRKVARIVGCAGHLDAQIECLRQMPYKAFIKNHWKFPRIVPSNLNFKPRIDGRILPVSPLAALQSGGHHHVPVLLGVVEEEWARSMGFFFKELEKEPGTDTNYTDGLDRDMFERSISHVITKRFWWPEYVAEVITHAYTDWENVTHPIRNRQNYVQFMSDFAMVAPVVQTAAILSRQRVPVYLYKFNQRSRHTRPSWWGSYHSIELDYVFGSPFTGYDIAVDKYVNHTGEDRQLSRRIMKLWTDFAKFGSPTPAEHNPTTIWQRFDPTRSNYMYITSNELTNVDQLRADKMAFWNELVPKLLKSGHTNITLSRSSVFKADYKLLAWVFLASSLVFFIAFAITAWKLASLKRTMTSESGQRFYEQHSPNMV